MGFRTFNNYEKSFNIKRKPVVILDDSIVEHSVFASVGTSTDPVSTGSKAITGVGFQPKLLLPFTSIRTTDGTTTTLYNGFGAATSASRFAVGIASNNAVTTSNTKHRHTASGCISTPLTLASDTNLNASLSSFDLDGFTYNYSYVSGGQIINHIVLGGDDIEISITQHQMNNTNAAQSFAHGLSDAPTGVIFVSAIDSTAPANTSTVLSMSIGVWSSVSQFGIGLLSNNAVTTTNCKRLLSSNAVFNYVGSSILGRSMAVNSVDASNVNVTYPVTASVYASYFWMIAIRGAKCQTGTFNCNGSTDPLTISCTGITPKLFMPIMASSSCVSNINIIQSHLGLMIGASDGTNNVSCGITDQNNVTTTNARRFQSSTSLVMYDYTGTKQFEATAGFSGESVVVTPSVTFPFAYDQGAYLIIGA